MLLRKTNPNFNVKRELICLLSPGWAIPMESLMADLRIALPELRDLILEVAADMDLMVSVGAKAMILHRTKQAMWMLRVADRYYARVYGDKR